MALTEDEVHRAVSKALGFTAFASARAGGLVRPAEILGSHANMLHDADTRSRSM